MTLRTYVIVVSVLFALVALVHVLRILGHWEIFIDGWRVPQWVSYIGIIVGGLLSLAGFRLERRVRRFLS